MVAISLYRGNLHRVPDIPRKWVMPRRSISLKQFRSLLHRRSKALTLLTATDQSTITTTVPLPPPPPSLPPPPRVLPQPSFAIPPPPIQQEQQLKQEEGKTNLSSDEPCKVDNRCLEDEKLKNQKEREGGNDCVPEKLKNSIVLDEREMDVDVAKVKDSDADCKPKDPQVERVKKEQENHDGQCNNNVKTGDEKETRQKEIVEELEVLNKKKHNLVQLLKQILNAEEELKRRGSNQVPPRPSPPLQVDVTKDTGSLTRQQTPRLGTDMNAAEIKVEGDDHLTPVIKPRQSVRLSSTSPSAESALRRAPHFQHQVPVPHPSRSTVFAIGSPSRFAPLATQLSAHPPNLQTLSVSGASYAASSPSPAASGGTSSFRDTRHPSPWN